MLINSSCSPFEFASVRDFLERIGYRGELLPEKLALALLNPLDEPLVKVRQSSHLTDSADRENQLRFYSERMVHQHLRTLAYTSAKFCQDLKQLEIHHCEHLSKGAGLFFRLLDHHLPDCDIHLRFGGHIEKHPPHNIVEAEQKVRSLYEGEVPLDEESFDFLFDAAHRCSYVGDYWTSERLLEKLEREKEHRELNVLMGVAASATARPFRAEYYYLKNYRGEDAIDKVRACYSLAMLCVRHHAPNFRDLDRGEGYLQEALEILDGLDPNDQNEELSFHKVFNRNGYALVLFKRKHIHEALEVLNKGIARLSELGQEAVALHKSVLTYNKMICHKALADVSNQRACFRDLIESDPLYPYYRLDFANSLMEEGSYSEAIATAEQARALDPFLSESYSIKGQCFQALEQDTLAEKNLREAHQLDPLNPYHLCNLGIIWNKRNKHELTHSTLGAINIESWNDANYESALCLRAESSIMVHEETSEALDILRGGLMRRGSWKNLHHNLDLISTLGGTH